MQQPQTLAELEASGWRERTVKAELQENLITKIKAGEPLFPGIVGYEETVIPEIENALLSGHDIIFLGERGQAKTRIMRALANLLDERVPAIEGCEINDSPFSPICRHCRNMLEAHGPLTKISWLSRARRYAEKLATPDVTIADLIGDVDPMKVAEGRYLSDELVIHYGLIPRANRGIFSVNEMPDLHEKIQVGLFNLLEERDIQIRGYKISMPLDICIVATANPEDYTSRGRIITPLKDRFGAQIRTHYPNTLEQEAAIVRQEMKGFVHGGFALEVPDFMERIVAEISQTARRRSEINHASGISVRMTIHNMETMVSNALRRAVRLDETQVVPRMSDLPHLLATMKGKVEWNFAEDHEEDEKLQVLIRDATQKVFRETFQRGAFEPFLNEFADVWEVSELTPAGAYIERLEQYPTLKKFMNGRDSCAAAAASMVEFILEGLAISGRITRRVSERRTRYGRKP